MWFTYISEVELGIRNVSLLYIEKICEALGIIYINFLKILTDKVHMICLKLIKINFLKCNV